jgi:hypothetical protein
VGVPLCRECYDYESAVLWNATCPELWRRTTIGIKRALAQIVGVGVRELAGLVRVSFTKVVEYQQRGAVHLHAVIRLDPVSDNSDEALLGIDSTTLAGAIRLAAKKVAAPLPDGSSGSVRWGSEVEVRTITNHQRSVGSDATDGDSETQDSTSARAVANYLAKYATKSTDSSGALDRRLRSLEDLSLRRVNGHLRRLVETAWVLGGRPGLSKIRRWAHTLGFGGHWLTKSRKYSVTFSYLRKERQTWQIRHSSREVEDPSRVRVVAQWEWAGTGWGSRGDAWLARIFQREREASRVDAREDQCIKEMALRAVEPELGYLDRRGGEPIEGYELVERELDHE